MLFLRICNRIMAFGCLISEFVPVQYLWIFLLNILRTLSFLLHEKSDFVIILVLYYTLLTKVLMLPLSIHLLQRHASFFTL